MSKIKTNIGLFLLLFLIGCQPNSSPVAVTRATPQATATRPATPAPAPTVAATTPAPTMTAVPTATNIPPTPEPPTVAASPTPTPAIYEHEPLFVCTEPALEFNTRETLGIYLLSHLRFVDEQTLTFEGWAHRPEPTGQNSLAGSILAKPYTLQSGSARVLFKAGTVDLNSGEVLSRTLDFSPPFLNPCSGACPQEVIGQSPDKAWQLIQVSDWREGEVGIWLVDQNGFTTQLVEYVPSLPRWQWAEDSSMLWFVHNELEYGIKALLVNLESTPLRQTIVSMLDDRLDPTYYSLAFSPLDKTVLSTPLEPTLTNGDELYEIVLEPEIAMISSRIVPGIQNVSWNEATQQYLLTIIKGNELYIYNEDGITLLKVPALTLEVMFPVLREGNVSLNEHFGAVNYALSPTGQRLAVFTNNGGYIYVFNCQENNSS